MAYYLNRIRIKSSINHRQRARYELRSIAGKPLQRPEQLFRFAETLKRGMRQNGFRAGRQASVRVREQRPVLFRQEETGGDGVHTDAGAELRSHLAAEVLGEINHGCLGCSVTGYARQGSQGRFRGDVDDRACPLCGHGASEDHRREHRSEKVQVHDLPHRLYIEVEQRFIGRNCRAGLVPASAVDEHVDAPVAVHDGGMVFLQCLFDKILRRVAGL